MRAVSPSRQSPPPPPLEPQPDKTKSDNAERNAAIAGAVGAGIAALGAAQETSNPAYIAARALSGGAGAAATAGTFSRSKGSIVTRAAKGLGAGFATALVADAAVNKALVAGGVLENRDGTYYFRNKFGVDQVTRRYV